jgi:hypothetical protein
MIPLVSTVGFFLVNNEVVMVPQFNLNPQFNPDSTRYHSITEQAAWLENSLLLLTIVVVGFSKQSSPQSQTPFTAHALLLRFVVHMRNSTDAVVPRRSSLVQC